MKSRRDFVKTTTLLGTGIALAPNMAFGMSNRSKDKLNIALIGVGLRGANHLSNLLQRTDVAIVAICDIDAKRIDLCLDLIKKASQPSPKTFGKDTLDYRNLLDDASIDAVIISTPWLWHTRMAKDAMLAGKYTGLEVSAANTMEECWDLVNTHEQTGSHLMILENVNYRRDIMAVLNMVRQNVFGELLHFRCGYQHDLRFVKLNDGIHLTEKE